MKPEVFLDSSFAIALSVPKDSYHDKAAKIALEIENSGTRMITTRAIVLEIGNTLAKVKYRRAAIQLIKSLEDDPNITIIPDRLDSRRCWLIK